MNVPQAITMGARIGQLAMRIAGMTAVFTVTLFLPAGTLTWPAAWVFLVLFFGFTSALSLWLLRFSPDLLAERMTGIGRPDQKTWDKMLLALTAVAFFAWLVLMGLDAVRFRWSKVPIWLHGLGTFLLLCSFYLFFVTFRENPYLSPAVRIQTERAQTVISTGPYRYVRHPMYAGFALFAFGTALTLGSWYGLLGGLLLIGIVARRAVLEERVLREELQGYGVYLTRVRYRIVPYVW
jgi:protein-S-isoprenylcysteine O-methyltransferase Ste14